jgi:hypothetical protein
MTSPSFDDMRANLPTPDSRALSPDAESQCAGRLFRGTTTVPAGVQSFFGMTIELRETEIRRAYADCQKEKRATFGAP